VKLSHRYPVLHLLFEAAEYKGPVLFRYIRACFLTPFYTTQLNSTHRRFYRFCLRYRVKNTRLIMWAAGEASPTPEIAEVLLKALPYQEKFLEAAEAAARAELEDALARLRAIRLEGEQWLRGEVIRLGREGSGRQAASAEPTPISQIAAKRRQKKGGEDIDIPQALLAFMEREARLRAKEEEESEESAFARAEKKFGLTKGVDL